jgi:hypothetical protein
MTIAGFGMGGSLQITSATLESNAKSAKVQC